MSGCLKKEADMKIMELKPCISLGSPYKGVSSARCAWPLHSRRTDNLLWQPTASSKPLTHLLPKCITSSFLPFTAELSRTAFPVHIWLVHSRCSEDLPFFPLALPLSCSDGKLPMPSLSPLPAWLLRKPLSPLASSSYDPMVCSWVKS